MEHSIQERARDFLLVHRKNQIWHRVLCGLAVIVVFITTYMLILPAVTMERPAADFSDGETLDGDGKTLDGNELSAGDEPEFIASYINSPDIQDEETVNANTNGTVQSDYVLPETGGPGTKLYTSGGLLLFILSAFLLCKKQKQRREVM